MFIGKIEDATLNGLYRDKPTGFNVFDEVDFSAAIFGDVVIVRGLRIFKLHTANRCINVFKTCLDRVPVGLAYDVVQLTMGPRMSTTTELLQQWLHNAPTRATAVASILRSAGLDDVTVARELRVRIGKADPVRRDVPTFDPAVTRPATAMLQQRFALAGTIRDSTDVWPSVADMPKAMRRAPVLRAVRSMTQHWEGSVPRTYPPSRVSLFGLTNNADDGGLTLLLWPATGRHEPRVFVYSGQSEQQFASLNEFLRWANGN